MPCSFNGGGTRAGELDPDVALVVGASGNALVTGVEKDSAGAAGAGSAPGFAVCRLMSRPIEMQTATTIKTTTNGKSQPRLAPDPDSTGDAGDPPDGALGGAD